MTFEDHWGKLAVATPFLQYGNAKMTLSVPEFKRCLRIAFNAGAATQAEPELWDLLTRGHDASEK